MQRDIGKEFMAASNYPPGIPTDEQNGLPKPEYHDSNKSGSGDTANITFKLPSPKDTAYSLDSESDEHRPGRRPLFELLRTRRSIRRFTAEEISPESLSYLLWASCGISGDSEQFRTAPSAGALHPIDTYLSVQNCSYLPVKDGIWRYHTSSHELSLVADGIDGVAGLGRACMMQPQVLRAPVVFFWTAHPYKAVWKYGTRGYRDIFLDAGHICQNLYLAGEDADIGVCAINAFYDESVKSELRLSDDGIVVYAAACGHKRR